MSQELTLREQIWVVSKETERLANTPNEQTARLARVLDQTVKLMMVMMRRIEQLEAR